MLACRMLGDACSCATHKELWVAANRVLLLMLIVLRLGSMCVPVDACYLSESTRGCVLHVCLACLLQCTVHCCTSPITAAFSS